MDGTTPSHIFSRLSLCFLTAQYFRRCAATDDDSIVSSRRWYDVSDGYSGDDVPGTVHAADGTADLVQNCDGRIYLFPCRCRDGTGHSHACKQVLSSGEW